MTAEQAAYEAYTKSKYAWMKDNGEDALTQLPWVGLTKAEKEHWRKAVLAVIFFEKE